MWNPSENEYCIPLMDWDDEQTFVLPHREHIKLVKQFKARGFNVVVWSQGGSAWSERVVKALDLQDYVDVVTGKPNWFIDDLPSNCFLPEVNRIWRENKPYKKVIEPTKG